jgi:hypothetical protein
VATQTTVTLVDDLDGDQAAETVTFGVDGRVFEIDLSPANAERLRGVFAPLVQAGRRRGKPTPAQAAPKQRTTATVDREQAQAVRDWARSQGMPVADKGRISREVLAAFHATH